MPIELPPEILGEIFEAHEFMKKHGKIDIAQRRETMLKASALDEAETQRLVDFEKKYESFFKELKETPEIERLKMLRQLAGTANVYDKAQPGGGAQVFQPAFHTRFEHGELCAELAKFAGVKLGLSDEEILVAFAAGMVHDIGHPALSHIGDYFLENKGHGDHETRGIAAIQDKKSRVNQVLTKNGVSPEKVAEVVAEEGYLGTIQSSFDTLSYLVVDSEMIQRPIYPDNGASLIQSLAGIDKEKNKIVVSGIEPWQELLERRAEMMRDVYLNPVHRRQRAAMRHLMQTAINKGHLTLDEIKEGTDKDIEMKLQSLVQYDPGAAIFGGRNETTPHLSEYLELWGMANGEFDPEIWEFRKFDDQQSLKKFLYEKMGPKTIEQTVIVSPMDYTKKKLTVIKEASKKEMILKSQNVELDDWDTNYIAYIPKF
ncbi:MAG: HD domain-containing protein [Parcubacteria group bacterium]|jgi:HD superfamily phosphohydrolase